MTVGVAGVQQATVLREDLPGFVFESNRGTKHSFTAETTMSPEFATGWTGHRHKKFRSKMEETRQKVCECRVTAIRHLECPKGRAYESRFFHCRGEFSKM